ncbi:MAG: CHC2 zinc finger domain-containing protein [Candidatus Anstonellales archaeon]
MDINTIKEKVLIPEYFNEVILNQMGDYYNDYRVDLTNYPWCKCPLHDEDTPSFRYYEETNTFYCFGCGAGGDVIELHRRFMERINGEKPSFRDSLKVLYSHFIGGKSVDIDINTNKKVSKNKNINNDNIDIMRLSNYLGKLEGKLLTDTSISLDIKKDIWDKVDDIDILVSLNIVSAKEALSYIKEYVNNKMVEV